jgi:hypothetical protein
MKHFADMRLEILDLQQTLFHAPSSSHALRAVAIMPQPPADFHAVRTNSAS